MSAFFKSDLSTRILDFIDWEKNNVDINALEEVKDIYIKYGHENQRKDITSSSLSGWSEKGSRFHFTIHFPSIKFSEHDKFSKGKITRKLMDEIQRVSDRFFEDFVNNDLDTKL